MSATACLPCLLSVLAAPRVSVLPLLLPTPPTAVLAAAAATATATATTRVCCDSRLTGLQRAPYNWGTEIPFGNRAGCKHRSPPPPVLCSAAGPEAAAITPEAYAKQSVAVVQFFDGFGLLPRLATGSNQLLFIGWVPQAPAPATDPAPAVAIAAAVGIALVVMACVCSPVPQQKSTLAQQAHAPRMACSHVSMCCL